MIPPAAQERTEVNTRNDLSVTSYQCCNMGRKKIEIKRITDERVRKVNLETTTSTLAYSITLGIASCVTI